MYRRLKFIPAPFAHVLASPFNDQRCAKNLGSMIIKYFGVVDEATSQTNYRLSKFESSERLSIYASAGPMDGRAPFAHDDNQHSLMYSHR